MGQNFQVNNNILKIQKYISNENNNNKYMKTNKLNVKKKIN